ncbi:molecular chaperone [Aeromonas hydrophila]|uniref:fimbrial biogenesis chaperone n=1 Tax=Aeromonas hydrophila TaxID=644 RepID=UPI00191FDBF1|nr:molecular chaperone [Aeromonas hydrophila]MBL0573295.1 molecular chaperone [Aeromonas hydrophila]
MKLKTWFLSSAFTASLLMAPMLVTAGPVIGGTRVIYNAEKKETSISIKNAGNDGVYLIQSWIDAGEKSSAGKVPFIVTPPLFRMDPGDENILRIVYTGHDLPNDRESVFWLNVKSIPALDSTTQDDNLLQVIIKSRIKLFYRPTNLPGKSVESFKKIEFSRLGNVLKINNPTPYFISFHSLKVAGKEIDGMHMISPKMSESYPLPVSSDVIKVSWQTINDYGGMSPLQEKTL